MMKTPRSVPARFRDFLPARVQNELTAAPLFSPSVINASKKAVNKENTPPSMHGRPQHSPLASSDDDSEEDLFWSPKTTLTSIHGTPTPKTVQSPFSFITRCDSASRFGSVSTPYKTLPKIEMLSLDYINMCSSETDLKNIVNVLTSDHDYPYLLRKANERLQSVREEEVRNSMYCSPSTLVMSLSLDDAAGDDEFDDSPTALEPFEYPYTFDEQPKAFFPPKVISKKAPHLPSPLRTFQSQSKQHQRETKLSQEVEQLTHKLKELETSRLSQQSSFLEKIDSLKQSKVQTEQSVYSLQQVVESSQGSAKELVETIERLEEKNERLQRNLSETCTQQLETEQRARELEQHLGAKIQELTVELSKTKGMEQKNQNLHALLTSAQRNLTDIKKERDAMLWTLADTSGHQVDVSTTHKR
jgi:hypothetical protein